MGTTRVNREKIKNSISEELKNDNFEITIVSKKNNDLLLFPMDKFVFGFWIEDDFEFVQVGCLERVRNTDECHFSINVGVRKTKFDAKDIYDIIRDVQEQMKIYPEEYDLCVFENPSEAILNYTKQKA